MITPGRWVNLEDVAVEWAGLRTNPRSGISPSIRKFRPMGVPPARFRYGQNLRRALLPTPTAQPSLGA